MNTSDNKESFECFECFYCYKKFTSNFMRNEHISYGHKGLIEFESSKIYKNLLKEINDMKIEIKKLREENKEK
jgi:hypothetical protein